MKKFRNDTPGSRIKFLRRAADNTQSQLAERLQVDVSTVSLWERDVHPPKGANLVRLAHTLQSSADYILHGETPPKARHHSFMHLPVISWSVASVLQNGDKIQIGDAIGWRNTTANVSDESFILEVLDDSMHNPMGIPCIPLGSWVVVDTKSSPSANAIVIARLSAHSEAIMKKLIIDGPNRYLKSLNTDYKPILIDPTCEFIGVVKQVVIDL